MAVDWPFDPEPDYQITPIGPPVLVSRYEDGTIQVRQKSAVVKRQFDARFLLNDTDHDTAWSKFLTFGYANTLKIYSRDDSDPPDTEIDVYIQAVAIVKYCAGVNEWQIRFLEA